MAPPPTSATAGHDVVWNDNRNLLHLSFDKTFRVSSSRADEHEGAYFLIVTRLSWTFREVSSPKIGASRSARRFDSSDTEISSGNDRNASMLGTCATLFFFVSVCWLSGCGGDERHAVRGGLAICAHCEKTFAGTYGA